MSGSGSACFALLADEGAPDTAVISAVIREEWGPSALVVETRLA
jgi:4-diphosphocytidyl-2C-methyl-D-erythritol kinase